MTVVMYHKNITEVEHALQNSGDSIVNLYLSRLNDKLALWKSR